MSPSSCGLSRVEAAIDRCGTGGIPTFESSLGEAVWSEIVRPTFTQSELEQLITLSVLSAEIVGFTAVHFHYAGFAATLVAGTAATVVGRGHRRVAELATLAVLAGSRRAPRRALRHPSVPRGREPPGPGRMRDVGPVVHLANAIAHRWPAGRPLECVHAPLAAAIEPPPNRVGFYQPLEGLRLDPTVAFIAGFVHEGLPQAAQETLRDHLAQLVGRPVA